MCAGVTHCANRISPWTTAVYSVSPISVTLYLQSLHTGVLHAQSEHRLPVSTSPASTAHNGCDLPIPCIFSGPVANFISRFCTASRQIAYFFLKKFPFSSSFARVSTLLCVVGNNIALSSRMWAGRFSHISGKISFCLGRQSCSSGTQSGCMPISRVRCGLQNALSECVGGQANFSPFPAFSFDSEPGRFP